MIVCCKEQFSNSKVRKCIECPVIIYQDIYDYRDNLLLIIKILVFPLSHMPNLGQGNTSLSPGYKILPYFVPPPAPYFVPHALAHACRHTHVRINFPEKSNFKKPGHAWFKNFMAVNILYVHGKTFEGENFCG